MITTITQDFMTSKINRPRQIIETFKGIVIHWTANTSKGANAKRNRDYFNTTDRYASTQFLVDDKQIIQTMPHHEVAWAVGATSYTKIGKSLFAAGKPPNYTTVSIEMCVNSDSDFSIVVENTVGLVVYLLGLTKLTINDIYRHYDITGKDCPHMYISDTDWKQFLSYVKDALGDKSRGEQIKINYDNSKQVEIIVTDLNVRKGPSTDYESIKKINTGDIVKVYEEVNGWYRSDDGWFSSSNKYSKIVDTKFEGPVMDIIGTGKVVVDDFLNIRKGILGVDKDTSVVGKYMPNEVIDLIKEKDGWYCTNKGWISGKYIQRLDERKIVIFTNDTPIIDMELNQVTTIKKDSEAIIFDGEHKLGDKLYVPVKYGDYKGYVEPLYRLK